MVHAGLSELLLMLSLFLSSMDSMTSMLAYLSSVSWSVLIQVIVMELIM